MHGQITSIPSTTNHRSTRSRIGWRAPAVALIVGMGVTTGSRPALADVIYTATPGLATDLQSEPILLDLDGDGTVDLGIVAFSSLFLNLKAITAAATNESSALVVVDSAVLPAFVTASAPFEQIGPGGDFAGAGWLVQCLLEKEGEPCFGEWLEMTEAYIGVRIVAATGATHYGWVHVSSDKDSYSVEVIGYAYETSPDTPICTGLSPEPCGVIGDLNGDGVVDGADLGILLNNWGGVGVGDLNGDGIVDGADLGLLLNGWSL